MTETTDTTEDAPQVYLITPAAFEPSRFPDRLARCLDTVPVACVRLALAGTDESAIGRAADLVRDVAHARDVAIVIDTHVGLAERHGLDGVHLTDHARSVGRIRKDLGDDAIVGSFCGNSRHDGMTAGELGADYVSFGPVTQSALGSGRVADRELFEWWSQMIEVPVVAEGALSLEAITALAPFTDFFGIGDEIWSSDAPDAALADLHKAMR